MENLTRELAKNFKRSYACKMGGTQIIVFPNGDRHCFNDAEYYSGRGAKYNKSIRHDIIGDVVVTTKQVVAALKIIRENKKAQASMLKVYNAKNKSIELAAKKGLYIINNGFVELSEKEVYGKFFDANRLANTLKISVSDASLLNSLGKTYVFAKSEDGNTYELYHSSLFCNHLCISLNIATPERIAQFDSEEWQSARYADHVGQTRHSNHFVC